LYASPAALSAYVNSLTSAGIVVEVEDHANSSGQNAGGGDQNGNVAFSGTELSNELAWYSSIGSAFANNPDVWFGTNNEPAGTPSQIGAWQQQTYQAIRSAGNNNPIMLEANPGAPASDYASMTNTVWDQHYYGWLSGYSTNQATVSQNLASVVAQDQSIKGANGATMPVIIGEYGNSTSGTSIDANAEQVLGAVQQSGYGSAAWAWGSGNPGDGLTNSNGSVSSYGQQIAGYFALTQTAPAAIWSCVSGLQQQAASAAPAGTSPTDGTVNQGPGQISTPAAVAPVNQVGPAAQPLASEPETAPPLAPASTDQTAPALAPASTVQSAPPLAPNSMSINQVAAMATGGSQ
jgi:hypothetical protein